MQKENEKIFGIMPDNNTTNTNIDNMIEKLKSEVINSHENKLFISEPVVQSSSNVLVKEEDQDIDEEITELENIIKKLQAEIVELTQSANKPIPVTFCPLISSEEDSCCKNIKDASPEILNDIKEPERDAGLPKIINDVGLLEEVKMLAESVSNLIKSNDITSEQKKALNDDQWSFSALWEDVTKSSHNNIEIAEKTIENIGSKLSKAFGYCIMQSSLDNDETTNETPISIESTIESSVESSSVKAEISRCDEVSGFFRPNDKDVIKSTRDDDKKASSHIENFEDSSGYDEISGNTNEISATDSSLNNVPMILDTPNNLPDKQIKSLSKEFMKPLPRCKSKPLKCENSNLINPSNKYVVLAQGSLNNVKSNHSVPMNQNKSYPETKNIKATKSSNGVKNNEKQTFPVFVSNVKKICYTDNPENGQPLDSAPTNPPIPEADITNNKNYVHSHLTTTENRLQPINTPNGPQLINTDNVIDNPAITKKSLEQSVDDSAGQSSGTSSALPKLFGSDLNTEGHQEQKIMKAEVDNTQANKEEELSADAEQIADVEQIADAEQIADVGKDQVGNDDTVNVMKVELDSGQDKDEEFVGAEEDMEGEEEGEDEDDEDDDDDDDDDDDSYDVD